MTPSPFARADAAFQEQVHRQWQDWRAYLAAHLALLDEADDGSAAFEQDAGAAAGARRVLDRLPPPQRAQFDAVRAARRAAVQAAHEAQGAGFADPDQDERAALAALLAEAEGTATGADRRPDWGDVPLAVDGPPQWYQVHVPTLRAAPDAAAYAAGAGDGARLRARLGLAGLLAVGALVFLALWFWPRATAPGAPDDTPAHVNGAPLPAWPARQLDLISAGGVTTTLALTPADGPDGAAGARGAWWRAVAHPLTLCAPAAALGDARAARVMGDGDQPARHYALAATRGDVVDLVVRPCGAADTAGARYGTLQAVAPPAPQPFGQAVPLGDGPAITVTGIRLLGPGDDPALPPDTARAVVAVAGPPLDWPALAPTLRLADGSTIGAPERHPAPDGMALHYLLPLPDGPRDLAWELTVPGQPLPLRWHTTLPAPPDRRAVVAQAIAVVRVAVVAGDPDALAIVVRNRSAAPVALTPADLALTQGDAPLLLPPLPDLDAPLAPGQTRTLTVPLPPPELGAALTLQIGRARWAID